MLNISHAHGRIPTNGPHLWGFLAVLVLLCLTNKPDVEHIGLAVDTAATAMQAAHALRGERRDPNP